MSVLTPPMPSASVPPPALMTADEFLRLHVHDSGIELIDGHLVRLPVPEFDHGHVCFKVSLHLGGFVVANRLGWVCTNDTFVRTRPDGVRGADLLYISYDKLPADAPRPKGAINPPLELVIEVRSPTDTLKEVTAKAMEYIAAGVQVVMLLDPEVPFVAVFRPNQLPQRFEPSDTLTLPDVLPGFAVPVASFFE